MYTEIIAGILMRCMGYYETQNRWPTSNMGVNVFQCKAG